ncbi:GNAT family N-acetyltransferase [Saccharibacillus alkalitolerans]|uniref:GNAT family N-acetyltransferase n=1 Tax=Saccharibacillus alkalitolerans TaxID=2705290 RepID=A0ABX0FBH7_9BACL|nr:GNAT family N-acetyltransferase [Saccharibacillus alkalitolerans]NGZ76908.1 GNAT family N-acetyltransferase [Saccharibacillus alkalitolerans]
MEVNIEHLNTSEQIAIWREAFIKHNMNRSDDYYDNCLQENMNSERVTLLVIVAGKLAGCAHLKYNSDYPYFNENGIPEINDLNVFPEYRRQGIANKLMDEFEDMVSKTYKYIGIGVGMYKDYGAAQRIYCRRGYIPDGNGIIYNNQFVVPGSMVCVDDDLNLYFTKELTRERL